MQLKKDNLQQDFIELWNPSCDWKGYTLSLQILILTGLTFNAPLLLVMCHTEKRCLFFYLNQVWKYYSLKLLCNNYVRNSRSAKLLHCQIFFFFYFLPCGWRKYTLNGGWGCNCLADGVKTGPRTRNLGTLVLRPGSPSKFKSRTPEPFSRFKSGTT